VKFFCDWGGPGESEKIMADDDAVQVQIDDGTQGSKILPGMDAQEDGQGEENVFSRSSAAKRQPEDEEAVRWAALQKLPTYDRVRKTLFKTVEANGNALTEEVDVTQLSHQDRKKLMSKILKETEEDNEHLLLKLRNRIDRCAIASFFPSLSLLWV
jgi:Fe2+ transport system protein B